MIRISASDLEGFRYWRENEESTMDQLVSRLRHLDPPTPQMIAGKAFAKLMETASFGEVEEVTVEVVPDHNTGEKVAVTFDFSGLDATIALPAVRELKLETIIQTPTGPVTLVTVCDGQDGNHLHDQKLSERFDVERYMDSLQWRSYLRAFRARAFTYDVFTAKYISDTRVRVLNYQPFTFYSYPGLDADVDHAVAELAEIIRAHRIQEET